jgi:hypothetical protein
MTRLVALLTLAGALLAIPSAASAADTTLTLNGPAAKSLRSKGVKIYEQLPAHGAGSKIRFPVADGTIATKATIDHQGALRFKRGKKRLTLKSLRVVVGPGTQSLSAKNGSRRVTLFSIRNTRSTATINRGASTVKLNGARLRFTSAGARLLRKKLGAKPGKGNAGTIKVNASIAVEPPVLARRPSAVNITSATIGLHVKESFVDYVAQGEGISVSGGAARTGTYDFSFPLRAGSWWDPNTNTADVLGQGSVQFRYKAHDIDITASNPEIELNGAASRGIFRFGDGKRAVLFNLTPTNPVSPFPATTIAATVPSGTSSSVFAGFYFPGDPFGNVTVSFSTT